MFQLLQNVDELASGKAPEQKAAVISIRDGQRRRAIPPPLAMIWAWAAYKPTTPVAPTFERNTNILRTHAAPPPVPVQRALKVDSRLMISAAMRSCASRIASRTCWRQRQTRE